MIITFFDFCYPLVSQKGFDLLLIVVIAVALLTFLLLISVLCDDYQSSFCQVASIESNLCLLFIPQCIRLNHMKLQFLQSPDIKGICLSVTPITIDLTCKSAGPTFQLLFHKCLNHHVGYKFLSISIWTFFITSLFFFFKKV